MANQQAFASILMFGCPGSGKGTQGAVLGALPNMVHLAMGDIFRALDKSSGLGKEFLSFASQGLLVPDDLTVRVFRSHLQRLVEDDELDSGYHTLILDGIPRTVQQVQLLASAIDVKLVLHLKMDDREALIARLSARAHKSNRPDDADRSVIEKRIEVYENETFPVLEAYPGNLVADVNADQPPLFVLRDIADRLARVVSPRI